MGFVAVDWRRRRTLACVGAHTVHAQANPECHFHVAQFDGPVAGRLIWSKRCKMQAGGRRMLQQQNAMTV